MTNGILQILKWKDKRDVHMCTTIHDASFRDVAGRLDRRSRGQIRRPACIVECDEYMSKVGDAGLCVNPCFELYHTKKDYKQVFHRNQGQNVESDDSD